MRQDTLGGAGRKEPATERAAVGANRLKLRRAEAVWKKAKRLLLFWRLKPEPQRIPWRHVECVCVTPLGIVVPISVESLATEPPDVTAARAVIAVRELGLKVESVLVMGNRP